MDICHIIYSWTGVEGVEDEKQSGYVHDGGAGDWVGGRSIEIASFGIRLFLFSSPYVPGLIMYAQVSMHIIHTRVSITKSDGGTHERVHKATDLLK